jgi:hypothetical protein
MASPVWVIEGVTEDVDVSVGVTEGVIVEV